MEYLERKPWYYSWNWVNSWQEKWKNPFCTCMAGLMVVSKLRLQDITHVWYVDIVYPVLYRTGTQDGNRVQVWDLRNTSRVRILSHTPTKILLFPSRHHISFPFLIAQRTRAKNGRRTETSSGGLYMGGDEKKKRGQRKDINIKIWEFGIKGRELPGNGRTKDNKLVYE